MTYTNFITAIGSTITKLINLLANIYNSLMSNHIFKTIIYIILIDFLINLVFIIYKFVIYIFKQKKEKKEKNNKVE